MGRSNSGSLASRIKSLFGGAGVRQQIDPMTGEASGGLFFTNSKYKHKSGQLAANLGWVFAASQVIADDCSAVELQLFRKLPDGDREQIFSHEVLDLLDDPNMAISARQVWNLHYQYLNLTGESYIAKLDSNGRWLTDPNKLPSALFPLPSHQCQFVLGESSWEQSHVLFGGEKIPMTAIIRDINPSPEDPYIGQSVIARNAVTIDTDAEMKNWNNRLFKNAARPGTVITVPEALRDDQYERLKQQFDEAHTGSDNAFKRIILEGGATISPLMLSSADLDFLESKRFTRDEILAMFRVSKSNLGIVEDVNRANAEAQEYAYAKRCVKPRLDQFVDVMNRRLIKPVYGSDLVLGYADPVPEDVDRRLSMAEKSVNSWLTIDEVRELYGYEPLGDGMGETLYVPMNTVPIAEASIYSIAPTSPSAPAGDEPSPDEGGELTADDEAQGTPSKTLENETNDGSLEASEAARQQAGNIKADDRDRKRMKFERKILRAARAMFDAQRDMALAWLRENTESRALAAGGEVRKRLEAKGRKSRDGVKTKDWAEDMVDWGETGRAFRLELLAAYEAIIREIGGEEFDRIVNGVGGGASADGLVRFDPTREGIEKYLAREATNASDTINRETEKQLRATLAEAIRLEEDLTAMQARVMNVFGNASSQRAYTIALTEVTHMQGYADVEGWAQTGFVEAKEWFTAEDKGVCGFCGAMDGKRLGLRENYYDKGDSVVYEDGKGRSHSLNVDYRSVSHPPLHPNCRCVLLPVVIE